MNSRCLFSIWVFVLAVSARGQGLVFSDGAFSAWSSVFVVSAPFAPVPPAPGSTSQFTIVSGGNPGAAARVSNTVATNATISHILINPQAVYDPALNGPLLGSTLRLDAKGISFTFNGVGQGVGLACEQGGLLYVSATGTVSGQLLGTWVSLPPVTTLPNQFVAVVPGSPPLDTSTSGSPITFGFVASNSTCQNCSGYMTVVAYDNWTVTTENAPIFAGSGSDLRLRTSVSAVPATTQSIQSASALAPLTVVLDSPLGTLAGSPLILGASLLPTGAPPAAAPPLWLDLQFVVILVDGLQATPLGPAQVLSPLGNSFGYVIPPGLGGASVWIQAAVVPTSGGVFFTDAHEIRVL